ncbi:MAG: sensor histidine kinase KdpD, partial [Spirochaetales bacterium]|nr:sensor histidine kinase KdpD [Spirochaetales bacterium]
MSEVLPYDRPDPDHLLSSLSQQDSPQGRLKIFLGYAAGVGKTFAMLQAAQAAQQSGDSDIVIGWVEPHARPETMALTEGLESLPPKQILHRGLKLREFDLDGCLTRHPRIVLLDELAHTNAPGLRHEKRWQDVDELLRQGLEVWTTLNIQHLDSMNDVVARITGIQVRETIPDAVFDRSDEVEVVDLAPEELLERLKQGKIYSPEQAERALRGFFRRDNLLALREITLRRAADRVGRDVDTARSQGRVEAVWPVRERLMVSVSPSPTSEDLLRAASRMAARLGADLLAVYIETPRTGVLDQRSKDQLEHNLAVAENLGAETVILQGEEVARDLVAYARLRNVTKMVVGKNRDARWVRLFKRTIGDELLRLSGDIDVYVMGGRSEDRKVKHRTSARLSWRSAWWTTVICAGFTGAGVAFQHLGMVEANIVLTLLLGVVLTAGLFGLVASVFASLLMVLTFNYFFTLPLYSFMVYDPQYYLVFLFLLIVGTVIGTLAERLKAQIKSSRAREQRMEVLYRLSRNLSICAGLEEIVREAETMLSQILETRVHVLLPHEDATSEKCWESKVDGVPAIFGAKDTAVFTWVFQNGQKAGWGTGTLANTDKLVLPLQGSRGVVGVLALERRAQQSWGSDRSVLAEALAGTITLALERVLLDQENQKNALAVATEKSRNALLHGLSHDLRTPLTVMIGTLSGLLASPDQRWSDEDKAALSSLEQESHWLARQVDNLLDLTRLSDGVLSPSKEQVPAEDLMYSSLARLREFFPQAEVRLHLPSELPLVFVDPLLIERALFNLLENAVLYSGEKVIDLVLETKLQVVRFSVRDRGPGIPDAEKKLVFQKFVRGSASQKASAVRGTGLGLAIVAAAVELHGGSSGV